MVTARDHRSWKGDGPGGHRADRWPAGPAEAERLRPARSFRIPAVPRNRARAACHDGAVTWTAPEVIRYDGPMPEGERATLQQFLDFQRATLLLKCSGLTGEQLAE